MLNKTVEKTISWFLFIGVPFTTLFLVTDSVTDPVNVTKLFAAGCVGVGAFSIALVYGLKEMWQSAKALVLAILIFIISMINSVLNSGSPLNQNLYGVFGRQTGFITYLVLALAALSAALLRSQKSFNRIVLALLVAGAVNVLYCAWALAFGDFISWNNPYGNILGLFGNPDFISAFLGMFIAGTIGYAFSGKHSWAYRAGFITLSLVALYEIKRSHAIQGLVVTAVGLAIVGFYVIRAKTKGQLLTWLYVSTVGVIGTFALGGALQKGPLTDLIYKTSVSLRGQYWAAGFKMGKDHPFTGVGMDSYGDWYRRARSEYAATVLPGPTTITNVSHNVVLDFFAYGGYPLLFSYLAILVIGIWATIRVTARNRSYDGTFVALVATWATYELQSVISINQVGLAIWGWVLVGTLVAYEYSTRPNPEVDKPAKATKSKELIFSPQLVGGIGLVIGGLIAVPPMAADSKWRSALKAQNVQQVEAALQQSYLSPSDSSRMAQAVLLLENSKLYDLAYKYAKRGVDYNPNYFDAWSVLYSVSKSSQTEKELALKNMKRLDPHNPDVLKTR
jgi:O-antigen ligase